MDRSGQAAEGTLWKRPQVMIDQAFAAFLVLGELVATFDMLGLWQKKEQAMGLIDWPAVSKNLLQNVPRHFLFCLSLAIDWPDGI
jgi:hypothetical protein